MSKHHSLNVKSDPEKVLYINETSIADPSVLDACENAGNAGCLDKELDNITNLSDTENLVTVMWANEQLDPKHSDTLGEKV